MLVLTSRCETKNLMFMKVSQRLDLLATSLYLKRLWSFKKTIILYDMGGDIKPYYQCASIAIIDVLRGDLEENIFGVGTSIELKSLHIH